MLSTVGAAFVLVCGSVMEVQFRRQTAADNAFYVLPSLYGRARERPITDARQRRVTAFFVVWGALVTAMEAWDAGYATLSIYYFVGVVIGVYVIPVAVINYVHNQKFVRSTRKPSRTPHPSHIRSIRKK